MILSNTTSNVVDVASTGTNIERNGTILCEVTDTGNGNLVRSGTSFISVVHGAG